MNRSAGCCYRFPIAYDKQTSCVDDELANGKDTVGPAEAEPREKGMRRKRVNQASCSTAAGCNAGCETAMTAEPLGYEVGCREILQSETPAEADALTKVELPDLMAPGSSQKCSGFEQDPQCHCCFQADAAVEDTDYWGDK